MHSNAFNHKQLSALPVLILAIFSASASWLSGLPLFDDGLRHISMAAHSEIMGSWGEVYPFSLFGDYDPWHFWHSLLAALMLWIPLTWLHTVVNAVVLFALAVFAFQISRQQVNVRSTILHLSIALVITSLSVRYLNLRPDNLSGLFVLAALISLSRPRILFVLAALYATTYYLFFLPIVLMIGTSLLTRQIKPFFVLIAALLFGFAFHSFMYGMEYWQTITYVLNDEQLRDGSTVTELWSPFLGMDARHKAVLFCLLTFLSLLIIIKRRFSLAAVVTFTLLSAPLWFLYERYFSLYFPCLFISVLTLLSDWIACSQHLFAVKAREFLQELASLERESMTCSLVLVLFLSAPLLQTFHRFSSVDRTELDVFMQASYNNSVIASNRLSTETYYMLYKNPSLHLIPSCSIGWFKGDEEMRAVYLQLMRGETVSEETLLSYLKYIHADYFLYYPSKSTLAVSVLGKPVLKLEKAQAKLYKVS